MLDSPNMPQPKPKPGMGPAIPDLVMADIRERDAVGTVKYGQRLQANDGRDHLVDAYQEALDLVMYLRQEIEERYSVKEPGRPGLGLNSDLLAELKDFILVARSTGLSRFVPLIETAEKVIARAALGTHAQKEGE